MLLRDCFFCENAFKLFYLQDLEHDRYEESHRIGNRHRIPNPIDGIIKQAREQEEQGDKEKQLAREREEDTLARPAYTLKKSGGNNLYAYQRECEGHNAQAVGGGFYQLRRALGKKRRKRRREEKEDAKGGNTDDCGK